MRVEIVQHCFGNPGSGGPVVACERLVAASSRDYGRITQFDAARGISFRLIARFYREIRSYNAGLVHVRGLGNEGFHGVVAARLARVPNVLVSLHGTHRDLVFPQSKLKVWFVVNVLEALTLRLATHIATVCEHAASRPFLGPHRAKFVGVVPNGVEVSTPVAMDAALRSEVRNRLGIPQEARVAVAVSRLTEEKGYPVLAAALRELDRRAFAMRLLVVGGGDEDGRIRELFRGLTFVEVAFVGHRSRVDDFLTAADCFVLPSLHENLSNALLEAMGRGLPAVATSVGGNVEVVSRGGGILVPPGDSHALARALEDLLGNDSERKRVGEAAFENVRRHYSVEAMVSGWEDVYDRILSGGDGPE